jgi:hypothetical protein
MIIEYLFIGIILIGVSILQLWLNGLWPFPAREEGRAGRNGEAGAASSTDGSDTESVPAPQPVPEKAPLRGGLWTSWTRIVGYVGIGAGVFVIVLGAVRG